MDISFKSLSVSKSGAATVKAVVKAKMPLVIFENVPAVVDGTICANIYQQKTKMGTAMLTLPAFGAQQAHTLEGIILDGAKEGEKYPVEFSCNKLWGIENNCSFHVGKGQGPSLHSIYGRTYGSRRSWQAMTLRGIWWL